MLRQGNNEYLLVVMVIGAPVWVIVLSVVNLRNSRAIYVHLTS